MTTGIVAIVLLAAILHAGWNALAKHGGEPLYSIASYQIAGSVVAVCLLPFVPVPAVESWWAILASTLIHTVYYFTAAAALRAGDLSQVYPLYRGLSPVIVVVGAALFAGEWLSGWQLVGLSLISVALVSLAWHPNSTGRASRAALLWGLSTSVVIACYTVIDGIGVRQAGTALGYILWLFAFECVPIGLYMMATRRSHFQRFLVANWRVSLIGGVVASTAYGLVIFAMSQGPIALVSSLRETSVIFAALIGAIFLGEPFGRRRIVAAALVAVGIVAIRALGATEQV